MRSRFLAAGIAVAAGIGAIALVPGASPASSAELAPSPVVTEVVIDRAAVPVVHRFRGYAEKCITVAGTGDRPDGAAVVLAPCSGDRRQVFTGTNTGEARVLDGMCLDVAWNSTDNGARVQVATCNGGPAQRWGASPWNTASTPLRAHASGKCLDVKDWNAADGAPLQLWDCALGQANQTWALVPA